MPDDMQRLLLEVADLRRQIASVIRVGSVKKVKTSDKEQKIRVVTGQDADGKDVMSPWLSTGDHRGAHRGEEKYTKGQNVMLIAPGGDFRQALVLPHAEADAHTRPDHASDEHSTYQYDHLRETDGASFNERWLASEDGAKDPEKQSVVLVRSGEKPKPKEQQGQEWDGPEKTKEKAKGVYLIRAKEKIVFEVGSSTVTITPDKILIKASKVTNTANSGDLKLNAGGQIKIKSGGGTDIDQMQTDPISPSFIPAGKGGD